MMVKPAVLSTPSLRMAWLVLAVAALMLSACTVTIRTGGTVDVGFERGPNPVIERFEVAGGEGRTFRVGQRVAFQIRTRLDGYVTLTALAPDGSVRVFARNLYVSGRRTVVLDGRDDGLRFDVGQMRGTYRVRASFTPARTDVTRVVFRGRSGESEWTAAIRMDIDPFDVRDVAETEFFVR